MAEEPTENLRVATDAPRTRNWGRTLFFVTLAVVLVFFWWLLIYSGGAAGRHG